MRFLTSRRLLSKWLLVATACCGVPLASALLISPLYAQEAEPSPVEDEAPPEEKLPPEKDPFGAPQGGFDDAPAADKKPKPAAKPADEPAQPAVEAMSDDPAVQAVLESHPKTAFELLRAIRILADLGHPKLAGPFVEELNKQELDETAKAALVGRFDSASLIRLAGNPELAKTLGPFIDDLFRSAEAFRRDPKRLAEWASQLSDPDESARAQATVALLRAREAAVAPLVTILANPARSAEHPAAKRMLAALDDAAIEPLLGALESPDAALRTQVIEVLGLLKARKAVASLLLPLWSAESPPALRSTAAGAIVRIGGRVPDAGESMRLLEHAAARRLAQSRDELGDGPPSKEIWHWNAEQKQSLPVLVNPTGLALSQAVRMAGDLYDLDPLNADRRRMYLTALLEAAQMANGLGKPLPGGPGTPYAVAAEQGAAVIEDVLIDGMAKGYLPAATAAAQILGDIGTLDLLAHGGATPSALARAAHHADRRLRFAATGAIMKLKPTRPFSGSSYVTEGLGFFAGSYGTPRILIAHPLSAEGGNLAGLAAALGFEADVATNGRQAYELAVQSPDYELVLIHAAIDRPAADELLAQLRRDRRTALLPVGFMAPLDNLDHITEFARRAGRAEAFLQPQNEAQMRLFVGDLLARSGRWHVTSEERKAQALAALDWLLALGKTRQRVFDIGNLEPAIVSLLYVPDVAPRAAEVLAEIGTDKTQRALVEMADSAARPLAMRKVAVAMLARSIRAHGILLSTDEIRKQYDLYNDNAGIDAETHEVLFAMLDVIEHKGNLPETK